MSVAFLRVTVSHEVRLPAPSIEFRKTHACCSLPCTFQQVAVFSRTWPAARQAGLYMPHKAGIDVYFISVEERQPAQQVCIAKNSFPVSRASLRTFLRKLI
jgi:hypothetical protein